MKQLLTIAGLAKALKVTPLTIKRWMYKGEIPYIKIGKKRYFDLEEIIKAKKVGVKV